MIWKMLRPKRNQEQRKLLDELSGKMMQTIDKYAQANGFSLILDVSNPNTPVLYASNTVDITKEIIDLYDKAAPTGPASSAPKPAAAPPTACTSWYSSSPATACTDEWCPSSPARCQKAALMVIGSRCCVKRRQAGYQPARQVTLPLRSSFRAPISPSR